MVNRTTFPKTKEEMIARGMKPFEKGTKRTQDIARKGGKKQSPLKRYTQRLLALKRKGLTDVTYERLVNLMEDRESSELDILLFLEKTKTEHMDNKDRIAILKVMLDWNKMKHGTQENNSKHLVVSLNLTQEEKEKEVLRLLK